MRALLLALLLLVPVSVRAQSLFNTLGGHDGVARIVDAATARWQADPRIAASFAEIGMPRFKRMLALQLCQLTGGGCTYTGRSMHAAHEALHLRSRDFNALAEDLQDAMSGLGIGFATQNRLLALLAPMHRDVVTR